jgi:hypothetical protein
MAVGAEQNGPSGMEDADEFCHASKPSPLISPPIIQRILAPVLAHENAKIVTSVSTTSAPLPNS